VGKIKKLRSEILKEMSKMIEEHEENKHKTLIGKYYTKEYSFTGKPYYTWKKLYEEDIIDRVDGHTKIVLISTLPGSYREANEWIENKNIIFYDDLYESKKKAIEKRVEQENKES